MGERKEGFFRLEFEGPVLGHVPIAFYDESVHSFVSNVALTFHGVSPENLCVQNLQHYTLPTEKKKEIS